MERQKNNDRGNKFTILLFIVVIIILFILFLFFLSRKSPIKTYSVSLQSILTADYSSDPNGDFVPAIDMGIVFDVYNDDNPELDNTQIAQFVSTVSARLLTPIPSVTKLPDSIILIEDFFLPRTGGIPKNEPGSEAVVVDKVFVPTATATIVPTPSLTSSPTPSVTVSATSTVSATTSATLTKTSTPIKTATITKTPIATSTAKPKTATTIPSSVPSNTPINTINPTATNTAVKTSTNTATNTSTSNPAYTATHTPTATNTSTPTIAVSTTETSTNTATQTPTSTNTATHTPTVTLTPGCSAPSGFDGSFPDGYVSYTYPADNQTGISLSQNTISIKYNQPMQAGVVASSVEQTSNYVLLSTVSKDKVTILSATYNSLNYTVELIFDDADADWVENSWYTLIISNKIENICGTSQSFESYPTFKTNYVVSPTPSLTPTATPTGTLTPVPTPVCSPANGTSGFITSIIPEDGANVAHSSATSIVITFNQPMLSGGGAGAVDKLAAYQLRQATENKVVQLLSATYDPNTYAVTIAIKSDSNNWDLGYWYKLTIADNISNQCGTDQGVEISSIFKTTP